MFGTGVSLNLGWVIEGKGGSLHPFPHWAMTRDFSDLNVTVPG